MAQRNDVTHSGSHPQPSPTIPSFRRALAVVGLVTLGLVVLAAYSYFSFDRLMQQTVSRSTAVSEIILNLTEGHLWFEEILSDDPNEKIDNVWAHFDRAVESGQILLAGGENQAGQVSALDDPEFRRQTEEVLTLIETFIETAHTRFESALQSQAGSDIDQKFDNQYHVIIDKTKILAGDLSQQIRQQLFLAKMTHLGIVILYLVLAFILVSVLYRYDSARTAATALIHEREAQLLQAQKLEAVGTLAGGIAHDFNNLLQAIIGYGEVLHDEPAVQKDYQHEIDSILKAAHRAADLTRHLLVYSRRQVIDPVDLDLKIVVSEHLKMIRRLIGENVELKTVATDGPVTINADRTQVEQILMNLCVNARDAIDGTGTITIETQRVELDEAYCADHLWACVGNYALMTVSDSGSGMEQAIMDQVFEPFFTTKGVGLGSGLGLSTVYGIVQQNGGMINIYSETGHGTIFKIYWPAVDRLPTVDSDTAIIQVPQGTETILLAEDDPSVRGFVALLLEKNGYTVLKAEDGQQATDVFDEMGASIDLALVDVIMPHKSGREVLDHIRHSGSTIPVVFASGYSLNAIHTDFVLEKDIILLEKPYRRNQLLATLADALQPER